MREGDRLRLSFIVVYHCSAMIKTTPLGFIMGPCGRYAPHSLLTPNGDGQSALPYRFAVRRSFTVLVTARVLFYNVLGSVAQVVRAHA